MATAIGSMNLNDLQGLYAQTQYFWFESSVQTWGQGAHITNVSEADFKTAAGTWGTSPTAGGQNILMNSDGVSIRNGSLPMMVLDNDSLDFNTIDTVSGTYTNVATFGASGMKVYSNDSSHTQIANLGYGLGASESGTANAPYYDLGTRRSGSTIGNYSTVEGCGNTASGYCAHAEGYYTTASGLYSHAEGFNTTVSSSYSHAEGYYTTVSGISSVTSHAEGAFTTASNSYSHAEGCYTTASGISSHAGGFNTTASSSYSHAEGYYTVAQRRSQTVIGEYNKKDTGGNDGTERG